MNGEATLLERFLKHDRTLVLAMVATITAAAWGYLIYEARTMESMAQTVARPMPGPWEAETIGMLFFMWVVMMIGMMLPTAAPMILLVGTVNRKQGHASSPVPASMVFAVGYLVVWTVFSAAATLFQCLLRQLDWLSPMMTMQSSLLGALVLILTGLYQATPLKRRCLKHCRSPLLYLMRHFRSGLWGHLRTGIDHGLYCLGCCWLLMGLLFVGGVMNLFWVAGITLFVLAEKVLPFGPRLSDVSGVALILGGAWILIKTSGTAS